jgi:NADPH-dependent 2,4-dienoyl-CoA reductase/sulfur reductase-like enzyme
MRRNVVTVDALVVGAGPAGLAAATALKAGGAARVVVVDREDEAGGTPRLCEHTGFGMRDFRRVLTGPTYARRWVDRTVACGVEIRTRTMVTGWAAPGRAEVTGPTGVLEIDARAIVLATGARERPRAARLVPGTRPSGIFTTGQLQQWVYREHRPVGRRAVIVGAEHVSYSAVMTLRHSGVHPVALVTDLPRPQSYRLFDLLVSVGLRVPVWTGTSVAGIYGRDRVDRVLVRGPGGDERSVAVDTVVFTGDFIPDNELARLAGLSIDPGTRGPACAAGGRTTAAGVFAAGNVVHPAETADVAAQRALSVGEAAAAWLGQGGNRSVRCATERVVVADPLHWVVPNRADPRRHGDEPVLIRSRVFLDHPRVVVTQGGRLLASHRLRNMIPNRSQHIPSDWWERVRPGQDVLISVSSPAV